METPVSPYGEEKRMNYSYNIEMSKHAEWLFFQDVLYINTIQLNNLIHYLIN